jgi:hypothetical protein
MSTGGYQRSSRSPISASPSQFPLLVHELGVDARREIRRSTPQPGLLLVTPGARKPMRHPFGYARGYSGASVVALVLLLGSLSRFEGIDKIRHPHELESTSGHYIPLAIVSGLLFRMAWRPTTRQHPFARCIRRAKEPELLGKVPEDTGVSSVPSSPSPPSSCEGHRRRGDGVGTLCIDPARHHRHRAAIEMKGLLIGEGAER